MYDFVVATLYILTILLLYSVPPYWRLGGMTPPFLKINTTKNVKLGDSECKEQSLKDLDSAFTMHVTLVVFLMMCSNPYRMEGPHLCWHQVMGIWSV